RYAYPVGSIRGECDGVETGHHVGTEITWCVDLVQELCGDRLDGDRSARALMFGDDARAVGAHLGDWKPGMAHVVLGEEAVVAARRLRAAFEDVSGDGRTGERIPVVALPSEPCRRRTDDQARVGDATGDDHVRAGTDAFGDAPGAEVGVGGERRAGGEPGRPPRP